MLSRTVLATAIGLAVAPAYGDDAASRGKIRLALDDIISSKPEQTAQTEFEGRIEISSLIQSHPDPLYVALEERYQSLPPFTQASEDIPEQYIVEATLREQLAEGVADAAGNIPKYIPKITSYVRFDDLSGQTADSSGNPTKHRSQTMLAMINPTLRYQKEQRKWQLSANYDYRQGKYWRDRDASVKDHQLDVNWTYRLKKGQELALSSVAERTHDRRTADVILDFNSGTEDEDLLFNRYLLNVVYRKGTAKDRSRYNVFAFSEHSDLNSSNFAENDYDVVRTGVGGRYAWQMRRQVALVAEAKYSDFNYDNDFRDNDHYRLSAGADMIFGRRIRANVRAGYEHKDFDKLASESAISRPVWNASLQWALRRKTSISVETGREIFEHVILGRPVDTDRFNVQDWVKAAWRERWNNKLTTETSVAYRNTDQKDIDYSEKAQQLIVSAIYDFSEHIRFSLDGAYTRETSNFGSSLNRKTFTFRTDYSL